MNIQIITDINISIQIFLFIISYIYLKKNVIIQNNAN